MRKIIITEHQMSILERLLKEEGPLLNNGSVKEYGDSNEIGTSCVVTDAEGNPKRGKDVYTDEIGKELAYQGYAGNTRGRVY